MPGWRYSRIGWHAWPVMLAQKIRPPCQSWIGLVALVFLFESDKRVLKTLLESVRGWCACAADGIRDARVHDARHTAATLLLAQGVDQRVVMEILGHSQISMTTRYTHVLPEVMTDAAARIGQALWGPTDQATATSRATRPTGRTAK